MPTPVSENERSTARRKRPSGGAAGDRLRLRRTAGAQRIDAFAADDRNRQDIGSGKAGVVERLRDLGGDRFAPLDRDEIDLGQRHDAATDAEQIDDGKVLAGLRHDAVVGRDDQQDEIDAAGTGQHVVDEFLVAGHVDEPEHSAIRRRQIGEAEVDGDAARLFFLEAIGVDPGERVHQGGLAMIDMAGGADDHGKGSGSGVAARRSASAISSADKASRAVLRNGSASALPPARARSSQASAATPSRATPAPSTCAAPSIAWPSASPRAARFGPPCRRRGRVAIDGERVVINHAEARHRRRDALLRRGNGPAARLDGIERNAVAFEQHPAQHVLRRRVAGFGRRTIEFGGARVILFDASPLK